MLITWDASKGFLDTMRRRRSVREFAPTPVPRTLVVNAIRAAALAPSGANQQPWTFVLIGDEPELRPEAPRGPEAEERESYAHRMSPEWLDGPRAAGDRWRKPHLTDAPWLLVVFEQVLWPRSDRSGGSEGEALLRARVRRDRGRAAARVADACRTCDVDAHPEPNGLPSRDPRAVLPASGPTSSSRSALPADDATVPDLRRKPLDEVLYREGLTSALVLVGLPGLVLPVPRLRDLASDRREGSLEHR